MTTKLQEIMQNEGWKFMTMHEVRNWVFLYADKRDGFYRKHLVYDISKDEKVAEYEIIKEWTER